MTLLLLILAATFAGLIVLALAIGAWAHRKGLKLSVEDRKLMCNARNKDDV